MSDTTRDLPSPPLPLTTRRLTIREYTDEDWPAVYAYVKDDSFWKHQAGGPPIEERVKALIEWAAREQNFSPRVNYYLAVTETKSGDIVGEALMKVIPPGHGQGEIGFGIVPSQWRKGYATEVSRALIDAGFTTLNLHRISAQCAPENKVSIRVMQKLDMAREGLMREHYRAGGKYWSSVVYALLAREYEKIKTNTSR
ncbi:MAG: GNAT family N-acetyltransferase [Rhodospirillaceae bacterium]